MKMNNNLREAAQQALEALGMVDRADDDRDLLMNYECIHLVDAITALRAALAEQRSDGMPSSSDERHLRRLLAARVGMPNTYYDDGEAHGVEYGINIDFMREPVADIDAKLRALNVARAALAEQPSNKGSNMPITDDHGKAIRHQYRVIEQRGKWTLLYDQHVLGNTVQHEFRIQKLQHDIVLYQGITLAEAQKRFIEKVEADNE